MGVPSAAELGEVLTTPHHKKFSNFTKHFTRTRTLSDPLVQHKQWKRHLRFGTANKN